MLDTKSFYNLPSQEKAELVFNEGKYIGVREYYNYFINLYLVEDIFIEVWYFREENKIEKIVILDDEKKLNLYIDFMNNLPQKPEK